MKKTGVIRVQMGQTCLICETRKLQGFTLFNSFVCETCEQKIVTTEAGTEEYTEYVHKMRGMMTGH